jgi:hypothetical protein
VLKSRDADKPLLVILFSLIPKEDSAAVADSEKDAKAATDTKDETPAQTGKEGGDDDDID